MRCPFIVKVLYKSLNWVKQLKQTFSQKISFKFTKVFFKILEDPTNFSSWIYIQNIHIKNTTWSTKKNWTSLEIETCDFQNTFFWIYLEIWIRVVDIGSFFLERFFERRIDVQFFIFLRNRDARCDVIQTLTPRITKIKECIFKTLIPDPNN